MASSDRKGGGVSVRTLAIASLASASAATITSRVFPPGTVYASALTPVIVAAVGELLNRPVNRVTSLREQRRAMLREQREAEVSRVLGEEPNPLRGAPSFAQGAEGFDDEAATNGHRTGGDPLEGARIHGRVRRRVLHPKVWIATGVIAFAIAVAVLTLPELIFGGAIATNHKTTIFGGSSGGATSTHTTTHTTTTPTQTVTVPAQSPTETNTTTSTTNTTTGTSTTDTTTTNGGATAPAPTPTSTGGTPAQP